MRTTTLPLASLVVVLALVLPLAGTAWAHTGLQSSNPGDGEVVDGPIHVVTMDFSGTPTAIDDGIIVVDAAGNPYEPAEVTQEDNRITVRFAPPLADGSYALSWVVRSDDTHSVDGSFSFEVVGSPATTIAPTTVPATTTPSPEQDTTSTTSSEAVPTTTVAAAQGDGTSTQSSTSTATTLPAPTTDGEADNDDAVLAAASVEPPTPPALASVDDGEATARLGRLMQLPAGATAVGLLAFAASAFAGRRRDLPALLRLARALGLAVAIGATLELVGLVELYGSLGELLEHSAGWAAVSRSLAGVLLVFGIGVTTPPPPLRSLSAGVIAEAPAGSLDRQAVERWRPTSRDVLGIVGAAILIVSFAFDGHTVSKGPRVVHALATIAHLTAVSVWVGGVVALGVLLWRRHRDGATPNATEMVLRFSTIATVSVAVAGAAGLLMAWFIVEDIGYPSTDWGRRMLVKICLVGLALAVGGYNRFLLCPALAATPNDPGVLARARAAMTIEAVLLLLVALATALLVAASTV